MNLFEDSYDEIFRVLNKHQVRFILVGGFAVNFHGYSRTTGDVDIWIDDSADNRKKLVASLLEYGIEGAETFFKSPFLAGFNEILLDNGLYLDMMSDLQFFRKENFNESYERAVDFMLNEKIPVKVIHINQLIEEKEKSERVKDKDDAEQLKKLRDASE